MRWPHYKHVFFDCDSTLTKVEGIDVLAELTGNRQNVESMTQAAMDGAMDLKEVYGKRLQTVQPTRRQVRQIRQVYKRNVVEDAAAVIAALHALDHQVYVISGGLAEPVEEFGVYLGVPRERIRAVGITYDQLAGAWWRGRDEEAHHRAGERYLAFDDGALTASEGKGQIVRELLGAQGGRSLLIGDGHSDLLAGHSVDLFVGFGGVVKREQVLAESPLYIHTPSLAPLLAVAAGPAILPGLLSTEHKTIAAKTMTLIERGAITYQDETLERKFSRAFRTALESSR